jgi:hypothetical protein
MRCWRNTSTVVQMRPMDETEFGVSQRIIQVEVQALTSCAQRTSKARMVMVCSGRGGILQRPAELSRSVRAVGHRRVDQIRGVNSATYSPTAPKSNDAFVPIMPFRFHHQ